MSEYPEFDICVEVRNRGLCSADYHRLTGVCPDYRRPRHPSWRKACWSSGI